MCEIESKGLLTAKAMRALEAHAIASGHVSGLELMERAGHGVIEAVFEEWPDLAQEAGVGGEYFQREEALRAVVLCGPGNNGGDGFVVERLLLDIGWEVSVYFYGSAEALPRDARTNHDRWRDLGALVALDALTFEAQGFPGRCDLVVDGLFGIGLSRPVDLPLEALRADPKLGQGHRLVAIDVPSGLDADRGVALGDLANQIHADLTVTFHRAKPGHVTAQGPKLCGKVAVKDIGL